MGKRGWVMMLVAVCTQVVMALLLHTLGADDLRSGLAGMAAFGAVLGMLWLLVKGDDE